MERFSYIAPVARFSHFTTLSISTADRVALSRISTVPNLPADASYKRSLYLHSTAIGGKPDRPQSCSTCSYGHGNALEGKELPPPPFRPGTRFYLAFSALAALSLVVALDGTSISVALPVIAKALNGSATDAFWAGTSFVYSWM
jgi:hypothetical protein